MLNAIADPTPPRSILVVLPTWVGDFVMATPTLRALRRRFANARITFLIEPNLRDLARGGDWMDECVEWPLKKERKPWSRAYRNLVSRLRQQRFDWAVLLPNSFRAALIARLSGARRRIGYDRDGRGWLLTDRVPVPNRRNRSRERERPGIEVATKPRSHEATEVIVETSKPRSEPEARAAGQWPRADIAESTKESHKAAEDSASWLRGSVASWLPMIPDRSNGRFVPMPLVEYYADLAEALGCERPGDQLELFTTPDCEASVENRLRGLGIADHHPLVVLSPGAKYGAAKCWPPDRFAGIADRLIEQVKATVIVTCGPGEEPIARTIGGAMRHRGFVLDDKLLTLGELKSLIRRSALLICNDAGPRHFAKAFGVPVVTVFGPTHPAWTATSYPLERIARIDIDCGPCQERVCPLGHLNCMKGVTVESVLDSVRELLNGRHR